eukprot:TRINITY_DN10214_c0_g1_i2.p1 TRINITY_DN10214_c0_g1~~TRINITY_DN10214_c0_g1_i2.p1  ORF type:complete len:590 (-),score=73.48 TRINITY_DN10214_c0_g1_i2:184-1953(-)
MNTSKRMRMSMHTSSFWEKKVSTFLKAKIDTTCYVKNLQDLKLIEHQLYDFKEQTRWMQAYFINRLIQNLRFVEWMRIRIPTPIKRESHQMIAMRSSIILFGGFCSDQQLHVMDINSLPWRWRVTNCTPPHHNFRVCGHTLTTVTDNMAVLFGGIFENPNDEPSNEVYILSKYEDQGSASDRFEWLPIKTVGQKPSPRAYHSATLVAGGIVVCGGRSGDHPLPCTLYYLDCSSWRWSIIQTSGSLPSPRFGHSALLVGDDLYLIGGAVGSNLLGFSTDISDIHKVCRLQTFLSSDYHAKNSNQTHQDILPVWKTCLGMHPPIKGALGRNHSASLVDKRIMIYGGSQDGNRDLVVYDVDHDSWVSPGIYGNPPSGRHAHSMVMVPGMLILFGGWSQYSRSLRDMYICILATPKGRSEFPGNRTNHIMCYATRFLNAGRSILSLRSYCRPQHSASNSFESSWKQSDRMLHLEQRLSRKNKVSLTHGNCDVLRSDGPELSGKDEIHLHHSPHQRFYDSPSEMDDDEYHQLRVEFFQRRRHHWSRYFCPPASEFNVDFLIFMLFSTIVYVIFLVIDWYLSIAILSIVFLYLRA